MKHTSRGRLLRIHIGERDRYQRRPLYEEILERCVAAGVEQVTVYRGVEGYGASTLVHRPGLFGRSQDAPIVVTIIAREDQLPALQPELESLVGEGLFAVSEVTIVTFAPEPGA